ncbi:hypothetical protein N4Q63_26065, partial [Leclercia adecarboxylata]|uniref:hypothetical protein n=1 Tax=Leclercia adecarboxylata TaxID=83655 RepID=UPI00234C2E82|nr:hypothetical protein [Leclercia adecarboxylata]
DTINTQCVTPCRSTTSQIECQARKDVCEWSQGLLQCNTKCSVKFTTSLASPANVTRSGCDADQLCQYDMPTQICEPACRNNPNQAACEAQDSCQWSRLTQSCKRSCLSNIVASDCLTDAECQWNNVNATCGTKCNLRYGTNGDACRQDNECMWDTASSTCKMNCNLYV